MGRLVASLSTHIRHSSGQSLVAMRRAFINLPAARSCSYAIKGAPNQKLLLEDIYYAIESRVSEVYR